MVQHFVRQPSRYTRGTLIAKRFEGLTRCSRRRRRATHRSPHVGRDGEVNVGALTRSAWCKTSVLASAVARVLRERNVGPPSASSKPVSTDQLVKGDKPGATSRS